MNMEDGNVVGMKKLLEDRIIELRNKLSEELAKDSPHYSKERSEDLVQQCLILKKEYQERYFPTNRE